MINKYFDIFSTVQIGDKVEGGEVVYIIDSNKVVVEYKLPCENPNGNILRLKLIEL